MNKKPRIQLTADEISAILAVAGDADPTTTFESEKDESTGERLFDAFESGMDKLREMLARRRGED